MRRFIVMHKSETGFPDTITAAEWVKQQAAPPKEFRIVEILVGPITEQLVDRVFAQERAAAYQEGKLAAQKEIRQRLGL